MSDTPSAELHTEPTHRRVGMTGVGDGGVGVLSEVLRVGIDGVGGLIQVGSIGSIRFF